MTEFKIADINEKERESIQKAEQMIKEEIGKDVVLIAWQQDNLK